MRIINDICVVIVFYNGDKDLIIRVKDFSTYIDSIYIVNNNSSNCGEILKELEQIRNVKIENNKENYGVAFALNQGLEFAKRNHKKYLLTMDQDTNISQASVEKLLDFIKMNKRVASVGPYYGYGHNGYSKPTIKVNYLITSGNLIDVDIANKVGGFTNQLFIDCVDIDFSFKLITKGFNIFKIGDAFMRHKIGEYENSSLFNIKYLSHSPLRYYYMYRNNIYVYKKYFLKLPFQCIKLFFSLCWSFIKVLCIENKKSEKLQNAIKGFWDGLTNVNF